jgi:hypothetical protein
MEKSVIIMKNSIIKIGIISFFAIVIVSLLLTVCTHFCNDFCSFLDALLKTSGIIASIAATLVISATLLEQQEMNATQKAANEKIEIQRNIENFNSQYEHFISLYDRYKNELEKLWDEEITPHIDKIIYPKYRNDTLGHLNKLTELESLALTQLSCNLRRILEQKKGIPIQIVNYIWEDIPDECKKYAGFYFAWNKKSFRNRKDNNEDPVEEELIHCFSSAVRTNTCDPPYGMPLFIPDYIPQIQIEEDEMTVPFNENSFKMFNIPVREINYSIDLLRAKLIYSDKDINDTINIINPSLSVDTNILFTKIFGEKCDEIFATIEKNGSIDGVMELGMKFNGIYWIYELKISFEIVNTNELKIHFSHFNI